MEKPTLKCHLECTCWWRWGIWHYEITTTGECYITYITPVQDWGMLGKWMKTRKKCLQCSSTVSVIYNINALTGRFFFGLWGVDGRERQLILPRVWCWRRRDWWIVGRRFHSLGCQTHARTPESCGVGKYGQVRESSEQTIRCHGGGGRHRGHTSIALLGRSHRVFLVTVTLTSTLILT